MDKFKNKVVIITGGNSGIGYATAQEFIREGANVIITGKRKEALEKASKKIGAEAILANQAKVSDIETLVEKVKSIYGKVDVLFLNAGVATFAPIEYTTLEQYETMMDVNFKGSFFTLQKFIPILNDGASVVFLTSGNTALNMPNSSVYSASKSAISHLARIAAKELSDRKIRVNTVNPGPTDTEMQSKFGFDKETLEGMKEQILGQVPLAKMGTPEDVAKMVIYLTDSKVSSFVTGSEFFIDGGMSL